MAQGALTHIDLFSGIGGFALAAQWAGFRTVCFVEIEPYAQEIIKQNFGAVSVSDAERRNGRENHQGKVEAGGNGHQVPSLHRDIRTFDGTRYRGATLLTGGFPCQPFSQAGKRRGKEDNRYLWPQMLRVIQEVRPRWVLGENVAGIIGMELDRCISDLEGEGYAVQPLIIPACAVDAKHRRDRVWIVAHSDSGGNAKGRSEDLSPTDTGFFECAGQDVADAAGAQSINAGKGNARARRSPQRSCCCCEWLPEPNVGGTPDGFPRWFYQHRGKGLSYAESQRAIEILRELWSDDVSQTLRWATRGLGRMETAEVLFAFVRECEARGRLSRLQLASTEALEDVLRALRRNGIIGRSSQGQESGEQFAREHTDLMCSLSRFDASWEAGIERVAKGIPSRVDRLKGLGNAIVPQVAYQIIEKIAWLETR